MYVSVNENQHCNQRIKASNVLFMIKVGHFSANVEPKLPKSHQCAWVPCASTSSVVVSSAAYAEKFTAKLIIALNTSFLEIE